MSHLLFRLRIQVDYPAGSSRGEVIDPTFYGVNSSATAHRSHPIVISGLRIETDQPHPKNGLGVVAVEANVRFRRLVQIMRIRAVVRDGVMLIITARIGTGPSEDRHIVDRRLQHWPLNDLDVLGRLYRRKDLSSGRNWGHEAKYDDNSNVRANNLCAFIYFTNPVKIVPRRSPESSPPLFCGGEERPLTREFRG